MRCGSRRELAALLQRKNEKAADAGEASAALAKPILISAAKGGLDLGNVDFPHRHHGIERPLGGGTVRTGEGPRQRYRGNLPGDAPLVLAPAALALLAAIADDGVPVAIRLRLVFGRHLKRERFAMLEGRPAVQPQARDAQHGELYRQDAPFLARGKIPRGPVHRVERGIGEGLGIKSCGFLSGAIVPKADRVLCHVLHDRLPFVSDCCGWQSNVERS
jgi:hypothetical protein